MCTESIESESLKTLDDKLSAFHSVSLEVKISRKRNKVCEDTTNLVFYFRSFLKLVSVKKLDVFVIYS